MNELALLLDEYLATRRALPSLMCGLWPLLVSASRHHRVPVPPHFWWLP